MQGSRKVKAAQPLNGWGDLRYAVTYRALERIVASDIPANQKQRSSEEDEINADLKGMIQKEIIQQEERFSMIVDNAISNARKQLHKENEEAMSKISSECKILCLQDVAKLQTKVSDLDTNVGAFMDMHVKTRELLNTSEQMIMDRINTVKKGILDRISNFDSRINDTEKQNKELSAVFHLVDDATQHKIVALQNTDMQHTSDLAILDQNCGNLMHEFDGVHDQLHDLMEARDQLLELVKIVGTTWRKMADMHSSQSDEATRSFEYMDDFRQSHDQNSVNRSTHAHDSTRIHYPAQHDGSQPSSKSSWV